MNKFKYTVNSPTKDTDRHGNVKVGPNRWYYRSPTAAKSVRLRGEPGSPEFQLAYDHAVATGEALDMPKTNHSNAVNPATVCRKGTLRWLCQEHFAHDKFINLQVSTQTQRRTYLNNVCDSTTGNARIGKRAVTVQRGELPFDMLTATAVKEIQSDVAISASKGVRQGHVDALRVLYKWALYEVCLPELEEKRNPCEGIKNIRPKYKGAAVWTDAQWDMAMKGFKPGDTAYLMLAIMRHLWVRLSDAIRLGPDNVSVSRDGSRVLRFTEWKGGHSKVEGDDAPEPNNREMAMPPELEAIIAKSPKSPFPDRWLVTTGGRKFTDRWASSWLRTELDDSGLQGFSAHGIRKFSITDAVNNDIPLLDVQGMSGHRSLPQLQDYFDTYDRMKKSLSVQTALRKKAAERAAVKDKAEGAFA